MGLFTGILTGNSSTSKPTTNKFAGILTADKKPSPFLGLLKKSASTTAPTTDPYAGTGYAPSSQKDSSGRPLLIVPNDTLKKSELVTNRTAPNFDITKPQKLTMAVLHNDRMPESASQAVRDQLGAEPDEQLDHQISLELGGSNDKLNLSLEKDVNGKQPSVTDENAIAKKVVNGEISYLDGQKQIARLKGVRLPDDPDYDKSSHPLASNYPDRTLDSVPASQVPPKKIPASVVPAKPTINFPVSRTSAPGSTASIAPPDVLADTKKTNDYLYSKIKYVADKTGLTDLVHGFNADPSKPLSSTASLPFVIGSFLANSPEGEGLKAIEESAKILKEGGSAAKVAEDLPKILEDAKPNVSSELKTAVGSAADEAVSKLKGTTENLPVIDTTQEAQLRAQAETMEADMGKKGGIKGFGTDLKNSTLDWINGRRTARLSGYADAQKFKDLDKGGIETVLKYNAGDRSGPLEDVQKYFDNQYQRAKDAGIDLGYKKNYLPQLWKNSPAEVEAAYGGKNLSLKPGFSMQSILQDYQQGLDKGLTPRFTKVSDLVQWYGERVEKAISDSEYFKSLASKNVIQPATEAPRGWKSLNPDTFPSKRIAFENANGQQTYSGVFKAPPDLARVVNNYLSHPETSGELFFKHAADIMGTLKNTSMSFGVPGTGVNVHGFNLLVRSLASPEGRLYGLYRGLKYMVNPSSASDFFNEAENLSHAKMLSKYGMLVSSEEHDLPAAGSAGFGQGLIGKTADTVKQKLYSLFGKNIFEKIVPATKTQDGWSLAQDLIKQGYDERTAFTTAGKTMNDLYGGINTEALGRDKTLQNVFRTFAFAPDFMETNYNIGKDSIKAFLKPNSPQAKTYRGFMYTVVGMYTTANAINYKSTGHLMYQNSFGHEMDVAVGKDSQGKTIYVKPFGSAADFIRLPQEAVHIIASGAGSTDQLIALLRNRLSKGASLALGLLGNADVFGNPLFGRDQYGKVIPPQTQVGNLLNEALGTFAPSSVENATGLASGKQSPLQAGAQAAGLPVGFKNESYAPIQQAKDAHSAALDKFRPTFERIQKMVQAGNNAGAQAQLNDLSDADYQLYKALKSGLKAKKTQ